MPGIKVWSEKYNSEISPSEYHQLCDNLNGFISILKAWKDKEKIKSDNRELILADVINDSLWFNRTLKDIGY